MDDLTPEDRINMNEYFGKQSDPQDWQESRVTIKDYQSSSTTKRDILYWSDKISDSFSYGLHRRATRSH